MSARPKCIENIMNICEGLNLVRIIKCQEYVKPDNLDIVLKTMYPHAQYNVPVPLSHGCKTWYKNVIWNSIPDSALFSFTTVNKLVCPIYNFDISNPEYIEPNSLSLDELIPAFIEFIYNRKYPASAGTEVISLGKPIKFTRVSFNDELKIIVSIVKLLSYNNTTLHDEIREHFTYSAEQICTLRAINWDRFYQDPNFRHISRETRFNRCIIVSIIGIIYAKLHQEHDAMLPDREINITEIQERLNTILISEGGESITTNAESGPS